jgi:hypothetical protein
MSDWNHEPLERHCPHEGCGAVRFEFCKSTATVSKGDYFSPGRYHLERLAPPSSEAHK